MNRLPQAFIAQMLGEIPTAIAVPQPVRAQRRSFGRDARSSVGAASAAPSRIYDSDGSPSAILGEAPRIAPPNPSAAEIRAVDDAILREELCRQGIYLTPAVVRQLVAETNSALHEEWLRSRGIGP